jgi:hypothetical protein
MKGTMLLLSGLRAGCAPTRAQRDATEAVHGAGSRLRGGSRVQKRMPRDSYWPGRHVARSASTNGKRKGLARVEQFRWVADRQRGTERTATPSTAYLGRTSLRGDAMTETLHGLTLFISGGSRGIGLAIARRAAADGANVALLAKTAEPHPASRARSTPRQPRSKAPAGRHSQSSATFATRHPSSPPLMPRWIALGGSTSS